MRIVTLVFSLLISLTVFGQNLDSLVRESKSLNGLDLVQAYNDISWEYKNSNLDSAKRYAFLALDIALELDDHYGAVGAAYNSIANYYEAVGKVDSSEFFHLQALGNKELAGDSLGMAASMNNLGILYDLTDKNEKSLDYYLRALRIYEQQSDDPFQIAMVQGNIGIVLKKLKQYDQAVKYYKQALEIYEEQGSDFGITVTKGNIGSILINLKRYDESIEFSEGAMTGYKELGYDRYIPYARHNMAIALDSMGKLPEAEKAYRMAIDEHGTFENYFELASSENAFANMLLKKGDFKEARNVSELAFQHAKTVKANELGLKVIQTLAKAEIGAKNYERATELLDQYIVGSDSLFEAEKTKQIFELQTKYETEKKEQQLALQEVEIKRQESVNQRNTILLASSGGLILLLIGLGIQGRSRLKWKNRQLLEEEKRRAREAEMNAVISSQEKERNRFARDLHDGFGQLISTLNLNLKSITSEKSKEDREKVYQTSSALIDEMHKELRNICFDLMPQTLIKQGLSSALSEFATRINATGAKRVEVNIFGLDERLSELQEISLYRISQEWVNNNLKYSDAEKISIQITKDEEEITLLIEDDGAGFDPEILKKGKGNGWRNMTSRANLLNAELEVDSSSGKRGSALILNIGLSNQESSSTEKAEATALQDS